MLDFCSFCFELKEPTTSLKSASTSSSSLPAQPSSAAAITALSSSEQEVVEFFVHLTVSMGMPRSIGELYGLLYCSEKPIPFEHIVEILGISKGTASQGLRTLQALHAVHTVYHPRDRRTFYTAEISLRKLLNAFLETKLHPFLDSTGAGLERLATSVSIVGNQPTLSTRHNLRRRVQALRTWHRRLRRVLPFLTRLTGEAARTESGLEIP